MSFKKSSRNVMDMLLFIKPNKRGSGRIEFLWEAVDTYSKVFRFFPKMPMDFNTKARRVRRITSIYPLIPWLSLAFLVTGFSSAFLKIVQLVYIFILPESITGLSAEKAEEFTTLIQVLAIPLIITLASTSPLFGILMYLFGRDATATMNALIEMEEKLEKRAHARKKRSYKVSRAQQIFSRVLKVASYATIGLSPALIGFGCYQNADSFYFALKVLLRVDINWRKNTSTAFFIWIIRFAIFLISSVDVMRLIIGIGILFIVIIWVAISSLHLIDQDYQEVVSAKPKMIPVRYYNQLLICLNAVRSPQNTVALLMLGGVGVGLVFLISVSIGFYSTLPFNVYIIAPVASVIILVIVQLIIPKIILIRSISQDILHKWKFDLKVQIQTAYFSRVVRSLRPLDTYLGLHDYRLFLVDKLFEANYYYVILDNITLVLMSLNF